MTGVAALLVSLAVTALMQASVTPVPLAVGDASSIVPVATSDSATARTAAQPETMQDTLFQTRMRASHVVDLFDGGGPTFRNWHTSVFSLEHRLEPGVVAAGVLRTHRFFQVEDAFWGEARPRLWGGAHALLRAQATRRALVLPQAELAAGLVQRLGAVDVSAGFRRTRYVDATIDVASAGVGHQTEEWYVRGVLGVMTSRGDTPVTGRVLARRFTEADGFVQGSVFVGRDVVDLDAGQRAVRHVRGVQLAARHFVTHRFAFEGGLGLTTAHGLPTRGSISGGMVAYW